MMMRTNYTPTATPPRACTRCRVAGPHPCLSLPAPALHRALALWPCGLLCCCCCRRVLNYYGGENAEDAFDMRKALPRDAEGKSIRPYSRPIRPEEINTTMTPDV